MTTNPAEKEEKQIEAAWAEIEALVRPALAVDGASAELLRRVEQAAVRETARRRFRVRLRRLARLAAVVAAIGGLFYVRSTLQARRDQQFDALLLVAASDDEAEILEEYETPADRFLVMQGFSDETF